VAFDGDPFAVVFRPVGGHPLGVRVWSYNVAARHPDIAVSVPAVISTSPHISLMRGRSGMLNDDRGRGNANNDLRERRRRSKCASEYSEKCEFLHGCFSPVRAIAELREPVTFAQ
jgi:hypothetical protein